MRRVLAVLMGATLIASAATAVSASSTQHKVRNAAQYAAADEAEGPFVHCDDGNPLCAEVFDSIGYNGSYTGHDEPSILFYDNRPGSGNNQVYRLRLPVEPPTLPEQDGSGGTWNFQ